MELWTPVVLQLKPLSLKEGVDILKEKGYLGLKILGDLRYYKCNKHVDCRNQMRIKSTNFNFEEKGIHGHTLMLRNDISRFIEND